MAGRFLLRSEGINPKLGSAAYNTRAGKDPRWHPAVKSNGVYFHQGEMTGDAENLKGTMHKIPFIAIYPGLQQRGGRVD